MKKTFVLDENILYFAISGTNEKDEDDTTCVNMIRDIVEQCHKIILDNELYQIYKQDLNKVGAKIPQFMALFVQLLQNSNKYIFYPNKPPFLDDEELKCLPDDEHDIYMVRSAKEYDVPLITKDRRLLEKIEDAKKKGFLSKLQVFLPEEAKLNVHT